MKSAKNNSIIPVNAASLYLLILLCTAGLLSGCKSFGSIGTPHFDPTYSRTLEKEERLLFSTQAELVVGTYMETEIESYPSYRGVLLLTSERMLFTQWNEKQQRYEPLIWTAYSHITQVKKHNNILLQYIAYTAADDSKFTYMLDKNNVDPAYTVLQEQIQKNHPAPIPGVHL